MSDDLHDPDLDTPAPREPIHPSSPAFFAKAQRLNRLRRLRRMPRWQLRLRLFWWWLTFDPRAVEARRVLGRGYTCVSGGHGG
jgi:hypothetical protein